MADVVKIEQQLHEHYELQRQTQEAKFDELQSNHELQLRVLRSQLNAALVRSSKIHPMYKKMKLFHKLLLIFKRLSLYLYLS